MDSLLFHFCFLYFFVAGKKEVTHLCVKFVSAHRSFYVKKFFYNKYCNWVKFLAKKNQEIIDCFVSYLWACFQFVFISWKSCACVVSAFCKILSISRFLERYDTPEFFWLVTGLPSVGIECWKVCTVSWTVWRCRHTSNGSMQVDTFWAKR